MTKRDLQAELELYKEAFFTKDNSKLMQFYGSLFPGRIFCAASSDTLYVFACRFDNCHAIPLLYELGDQTYNKTTYMGRSPLHCAISYRNKECIQALFEIPEYRQISKQTFTFIECYWYFDNGDAAIEIIVEAAFRIHKIDYFDYPIRSNSNMSRIFRAVCGDRQDNVNEDDILGIRYRVFFNRSLTSRLLLKS
jgi:hypothetical protein